MGALESIKLALVRRRLLANRVREDAPSPLEEWIRIKAQMTAKGNRELRQRIGAHDLLNMDRGDFMEYQLFRFREQLRYVQRNSPFYRDLLADLDADSIRTYGDLERVPFTTPEDLAAEPMRFMAASRTRNAREFTTTGTTGTRKVIGFTLNDLISKIDIISAALKGIGMRDGDSLHIMFPAVSAWDPSVMMAGACRIAGYGSSTCTSPDMEEQMEVMRGSGATHIIGLPSFIYRVTSIMGSGTDLRTLGIKKIISTSEPLSESMRATLEDAWGCKVVDVWGMTELGLACALECDCQDGLHTDEANILFEVVDPETGRQVPPGEPGELVVTSLNAESTPVIRYRTRDISALHPSPCGCGARFNMKIRKPAGRMDMQFKVGMGYKIYPVLFDEAVFSDPAVVDYQVRITKEGFKDVLTFVIETAEGTEGLRERIVAAVSGITEIADGIADDLLDIPRVEFTDVGSMEYAAKAKKITDLR